VIATLFDQSFFGDDIDRVSQMVVQSGRNRPSSTQLVVTANTDHLVSLRENAQFRSAYSFAWLRLIDGFPISLYAKLRGTPVPRVPGADLIVAMFELFSADTDKIFFVVPNDQTRNMLLKRLAGRGFTSNSLNIHVPAFGFEKDVVATAQLISMIRNLGTTHLVMGVGAPKSEIWVADHSSQLGPMVAVCVGAGVEFLAGTKRRAPAWMSKYGLEWTWRAAQDPRRLVRRYAIGFLRLIPIVFNDLRRN
jgi:N-acetylglucosaminyldiphosphoundecaprenol N-acetyl-beta-D-mannosaminyltransferase